MKRLLILAVAVAATTGAFAQSNPPATTAKAIFAGGCFWCVESDFDKVPGVISTTSGYTGGRTRPIRPTSRSPMAAPGMPRRSRSCSTRRRSAYEKLLDVFWHNIDPLAKDYQFCDHGDQYRSAIFYQDDAQRRLAEASKTTVQARFKQPVQTRDRRRQANSTRPRTITRTTTTKNPIRYKFYRFNCGRDARLQELWGKVE